jgi:hypothetical protein
MYVPMPENRKYITVIESICAIGTVIPPIIIAQGRQHMTSWYNDKLSDDDLVLLSESGYTNNELAMLYLEHFTKCTNAGSDQPQKVLLMDSHTSDTTPESTVIRAKSTPKTCALSCMLASKTSSSSSLLELRSLLLQPLPSSPLERPACPLVI